MKSSSWTIDVESMVEMITMWTPEWTPKDYSMYQLLVSHSRAHEDFKTVMVF